MKITIDGRRLDTEKATHHWNLCKIDQQSNRHAGMLYLSSAGTWYAYTPSQWANMHRWELTTPEQALEDYDAYLDDDQKAEIAELGNLGWE